MGEVAELDAYRPHLSGHAICVGCAHEFIAVAPVGVTWFECRKCGAHRAHMRLPCEVSGPGTSVWTCACGCTLLQCFTDETGTGFVCVNCGDKQRF